MLYVDIEKRLSNFTLRAKINITDERVALLGASGAGKSMTLKCISGIARPDSGRIVLDDTILFDSEKRIDLPPQKRNVGYLFQDYALFPNMTVLQNIIAGLHHLPHKERESQARELIDSFHLNGLADKRPDTLSGGEKQRVALARTLAANPKVILLDEPFSSLDTELKWDLEDELKLRLQDFSGNMLMVTHNIDEAIELCDSVYTIERGTVSEPQAIREYYKNILSKNNKTRITLSKECAETIKNDR